MSKEFGRHFDEEKFQQIKEKVACVANIVKESYGELDFQIRPNNCFNVYYWGNSLARVNIQKDNFRIEKAEAFNKNSETNKGRSSNNYSHLFEFFNSPNLKELCRNIKKVDYQDELRLEHQILSDNSINSDFFIIDRQIQGVSASRKELDLLGLRKTVSGEYKFILLEVKLVYNKDLNNSKDEIVKVISQINEYETLFKSELEVIAKSYEINYSQKKALGLFPDEFPESIKINSTDFDKSIVIGGNYQIAVKVKERLEKEFDGKIIPLKFDLKEIIT